MTPAAYVVDKVGNASEGAPLVMAERGMVAKGSVGGVNAGPAGGAGVPVEVPEGAGPGAADDELVAPDA